MQYSVTYAKSHLSQLLRRAEAGEEVILNRRGKPVARLVALTPTEKQTLLANLNSANSAE